MKKYLWVIAGAVLILSGCLPKEETPLVLDPEMENSGDADIDFTELHNDTLDALASIHDGEPFSFIRSIDISGDAKQKTVTVTATAVDGADTGDAEAFAQALLCLMNDSAMMQDSSFTPSSPEDFGGFYDAYTLKLTVTNETNGAELYSLDVPAGGEIPLSPDYEKYIEEWERDYKVIMENVIYDPEGNIVSYG